MEFHFWFLSIHSAHLAHSFKAAVDSFTNMRVWRDRMGRRGFSGRFEGGC